MSCVCACLTPPVRPEPPDDRHDHEWECVPTEAEGHPAPTHGTAMGRGDNSLANAWTYESQTCLATQAAGNLYSRAR